MFTGIIETVGTITGVEPRAEIVTLAIDVGEVAEGVALGDSVAVGGVCLTVTDVSGAQLCFECIRETLERTTLGELEKGSRVNLERALRAGGRLDGHIVQGHVDGTGRVRAVDRDGEDVRLELSCGPEVAEFLVEKGSVAVDGVALTVVGVEETAFDVALIPHTLAVTTLGERRVGDRVNLEADVLGKYVKRYLDRIAPRTGSGT